MPAQHWTPEQAREMAKRGNAAKAALRAAARERAANLPALAQDLSFPDRTKARLRAQVELLLTRIDEEAVKTNADGARLDRLASAVERVLELERILDGRPGPGNRRPPREDAPSSKVQPAPRPAFTHAGPASAAAMAGRPATPAAASPTSPPTSEGPGLTERPDF